MGPDKHKAIFGDLKKSCDIKLYFDTSLFMDIIKFYIYVPHCERPAISWDRAPQGAQWSGPWTWCRRESSQTRWHHVTTDLSVATASWSFQEELWSNSHWHRGSPNCPRILMNKKDFIMYVVYWIIEITPLQYFDFIGRVICSLRVIFLCGNQNRKYNSDEQCWWIMTLFQWEGVFFILLTVYYTHVKYLLYFW